MDSKRSTRGTPPNDEDDWRYIWDAANKAHSGWPVVSVAKAIFGNLRVILIGGAIALLLGGQRVLEAWGIF